MRKDYVQLSHLDCEVKEENHSWIFHVPICSRIIYLYVWGDLGNTKQLLKIPLGGFLALHDDVMHGGICGCPGNVRVHGGIFDSIAIETTNRLTYKSSVSLEIISTEHSRENNVRG